jgi:hypothetical protein
VSRPLLTVSTANQLVLHSQRLYTFTTSNVKASKNFEPNHAVFARHHTTLPRCGCIGTLHGLYKGSLASYDPQGPDQLARYKVPLAGRYLTIKRITHPVPC